LKHKMPFCQTEIFDSLSKGLTYAEEIGFPVVLKVYGRKRILEENGTILQKTLKKLKEY